MKRVIILAVSVLSVFIISCKKDKATTTDVKTKFVGNWVGNVMENGSTALYKFSLQINADNSVVNIDSAFSNQVFPGTYTYTSDSLKISYNNGTKWNLGFSNNYTVSAGSFVGYNGAVGTVSMSKK
jgi:hypothetical protein